jgi:hypothetical protein
MVLNKMYQLMTSKLISQAQLSPLNISHTYINRDVPILFCAVAQRFCPKGDPSQRGKVCLRAVITVIIKPGGVHIKDIN